MLWKWQWECALLWGKEGEGSSSIEELVGEDERMMMDRSPTTKPGETPDGEVGKVGSRNYIQP